MVKKQQLLEEVRQGKARIDQMLLDGYRHLLGERLEEVMSSPSAAESLLTHPDPRIREGCLAVLAHYWPPNPRLDAAYRTIAARDPDPEVRITAVSCLARVHCGSRDTVISNLLAKIVADNNSPMGHRHIAYFGLLDVQGIPVSEELMDEAVYQKDSLPKSLDWSLVNSFL